MIASLPRSYLFLSWSNSFTFVVIVNYNQLIIDIHDEVFENAKEYNEEDVIHY